MNDISFSCKCGRKINVAPQHAGKKAKCPQCREEVLIPVILVEEEQTSPAPTSDKIVTAQPARALPVQALPTATPVKATPVATPVKAQPVKPKPASRSSAPLNPRVHTPPPVKQPEVALPPLIEAAQEDAPSAWELADEPLPELTSENLLAPIIPFASSTPAATIEPLPPLSTLAEEVAPSHSASPYSNYTPPPTIVRSGGGGDGAWKDYMWIPCSIIVCVILTLIMQSSNPSFARANLGGTSWNAPSATPSSSFTSPNTRTRSVTQGASTRVPGAGKNGDAAAPFRNPTAADNSIDNTTENIARQAVVKDWSRDERVRAIISRYTNIDPLTQTKITRQFGNGPGAHWEKAPLEKVILVYRELECLAELSKLVKSIEDLEGLKKGVEHAKSFDFQGNFGGQTDRAIQEVVGKMAANPRYANFVMINIAPKVKEAEEKFKEAFAKLQKDYGEDAADLISVLPYQLKDDPMLGVIDEMIKSIPADIEKQVAALPPVEKEPDLSNPAAMMAEARKRQKQMMREHQRAWDKDAMEWDHRDSYNVFENCYKNAMYVDVDNFNQQVFWAPGLKQPAMFLRIGMVLVEKGGVTPSVPPPLGGRYPQITREFGEWELMKNNDAMTKAAGKISDQIAISILDRERRGSCGEWGRNLKEKGLFAMPGLLVLRKCYSEDEAIDLAQKIRMDNLIELIMNVKKDAKGNYLSADIMFKLIDLRSKKELYVQPKPMTSVAVHGPKGAELVRKELGDLFAYIDEKLLLQDMAPKLAALKKAKAEQPEIIIRRIQTLIDEKDPYEPLALLIEARYYLENGIATKEQLAPVFEKVLGHIRSKQFLNGDSDAREDVIKEFVKDK